MGGVTKNRCHSLYCESYISEQGKNMRAGTKLARAPLPTDWALLCPEQGSSLARMPCRISSGSICPA